MRPGRVARRYAAALMGIAEERGRIDAVAADLDSVNRLLATSRELQLLVASPVVRPGKKRAIFHDLFASSLGEEVRVFLDLLINKGREEHIPGLAEEFAALRDAHLGIVTAHAATAIPIDKQQQDHLQARLADITGRTIRLALQLDPSLVGGLVVRIGDTVYDGSVTRQLELLRHRWAAGTPSAH